MPRQLPGATGVDESEPRFTVSAASFDAAQVALVEDFLTVWRDVLELGARHFLAPFSAFLMLPQLRAFWPLSSADESGNAYDLSGQGHTLTFAGSSFADYYLRKLTPTIVLSRRNGDYLTTPSSAALDLVANFSCGLWLRVQPGSHDAQIVGKAGLSGRSWSLDLVDAGTATPYFRFSVSTDGSNSFYHELQPVPLFSPAVYSTWLFLVATYDAAGAPLVFCNGRLSGSLPTGSVLGDLHSNGEPIQLGHAADPAAAYITAEIALPFLCAATLVPAQIGQLHNATRHLFP